MNPQDVLDVKERAEKSNTVPTEGIAASQSVVGETDSVCKESVLSRASALALCWSLNSPSCTHSYSYFIVPLA